MATQSCRLIQDENLIVHHKGASFGRDTNASKSKKAAGLGGLKPLTNITNSGKPSPHKALQKNCLKNDIEEQCLHNHKEYTNLQTRVLIQDENLNARYKGASGVRKSNVSKAQKKSGLGGRRALTNITNSKKSPHQVLKKNHSKKLNDIAEERFLHNHQECINSQTRGIMDMQLLLRTLGIEDDLSMQLATPAAFPVSRQAKVDFASPPRFLEYEEIPEFLNEDGSPPRCWTPVNHYSYPSVNHYPSPNLKLLSSP